MWLRDLSPQDDHRGALANELGFRWQLVDLRLLIDLERLDWCRLQRPDQILFRFRLMDL